MVHPKMGETISSYKQLMQNPATAEIWQTAFGKTSAAWHKAIWRQGKKGQIQSLWW
jgi:hypothetical protein